MSKSLGNIIKARDFIEDNSAEIFKFIILSVHYRSILNFNDKIINQTINNLFKIYSSLKLSSEINNSEIDAAYVKEYENYFTLKKEEIDSYINNDFNTPGAFAVIFDIIKKFNLLTVNKQLSSEIKYFSIHFDKFFNLYGGILGLFQENRKDFIDSLNNLLLKSKEISEQFILSKITERNHARKEKDFKLSDTIRDDLMNLGIELKDNPDSTTSWYIKI
jgi:cysteinyl-tRNA synthetase